MSFFSSYFTCLHRGLWMIAGDFLLFLTGDYFQLLFAEDVLLLCLFFCFKKLVCCESTCLTVSSEHSLYDDPGPILAKHAGPRLIQTNLFCLHLTKQWAANSHQVSFSCSLAKFNLTVLWVMTFLLIPSWVWSVVETPIPTANPCAKSETLTHMFSMQCSATVIGSFPLLMPPNNHCCSTASAYVQQTTDALAPPTPSSPFLYNLVSGSFLPCGAMQSHNPGQHRGSCASYISLIMQTVSIGVHRWNSICSSGHSCTPSCCTEVVFCILNVECLFATMHKKEHTST